MRKCTDCKYCVEKYCTSIDGTEIYCLLSKNPSLPIDEYYSDEPALRFARNCKSFIAGKKVEIDTTDGEERAIQDYSDDPEIIAILKEGKLFFIRENLCSKITEILEQWKWATSNRDIIFKPHDGYFFLKTGSSSLYKKICSMNCFDEICPFNITELSDSDLNSLYPEIYKCLDMYISHYATSDVREKFRESERRKPFISP